MYARKQIDVKLYAEKHGLEIQPAVCRCNCGETAGFILYNNDAKEYIPVCERCWEEAPEFDRLDAPKYHIGDKLVLFSGKTVEVLKVTDGFMMVRPVGRVIRTFETIGGEKVEIETAADAYHISPRSEAEEVICEHL